VLVTGGGDVSGGGHLGHAHPQDPSRRAGGPRADADQDAADARLHQLQRGLVVDAVADHHGDVASPDELLERELVIRLGGVAGGEHSALHDEDVRARLLRKLGSLFGASGDRRDCTRNAGGLDRVDALGDELGLDGLAVNLFEKSVDLRLVCLGDSLDDRGRILVAGVDAVKVQHRKAAELAHRDSELDVDDAVHCRTPDWDREPEAVAKREGDVDLVRV